MSETDNRPRRNCYRIRSGRTWTLIRERYLAGESAPRLAEVFDVTEAAIRRRITREGWSKRSLAEATPVEPADAGLADVIAGQLDGDLTPREAARLALGEAVKLVRGGKMGLAGEAARVADVMGRAAARLGEAVEEAGDDEAAFEAVRRKVLGFTSPSAPGSGPWPARGQAPSEGEDRPRSGQEGATPADGSGPLHRFAVPLPHKGGGDVGASWAGTESPPPGGCAACPPHSPDANAEVNG